MYRIAICSSDEPCINKLNKLITLYQLYYILPVKNKLFCPSIACFWPSMLDLSTKI